MPAERSTEYVPMLRDLADELERMERERPSPTPTENTSHDVEIASIELGGPDYRWSVRSVCGVVKVCSSRDGYMLATDPERARWIGRQFALAMAAAAEATDQASRGGPRMPLDHGDDLDRDDLLRWAEMYGHPEEWAKRAQAAHGRAERLWKALREVGDAYGCFAGCTGALPGAPDDGSGHTPACAAAGAALGADK